MFEIHRFAIGAQDQMPFDARLNVFLDVALEEIVPDGAALIERCHHRWHDAFEIEQFG